MTDSTRKYHSRMRGWTWAVGAFAALFLAIGNPGAAGAAQLDGTISFEGAFMPVDSSFAATTLALATGIDYNGDGIANTSPYGLVSNATGTFAGLVGQNATLTDFTFDPLSAPVSPLWQIGMFSFGLNSVASTYDSFNNTLSLSGLGTFRGAGYDETPGTWSFFALAGDGRHEFTFSADGTAIPIPEPEIYAMMGFGLGLLGWVGRRKKLQAA
jgi:hypothetical protein